MTGKNPIAPILIPDKATVAFSAEEGKPRFFWCQNYRARPSEACWCIFAPSWRSRMACAILA
jgi:hypothetical protein